MPGLTARPVVELERSNPITARVAIPSRHEAESGPARSAQAPLAAVV
jgi:hypothetical protein